MNAGLRSCSSYYLARADKRVYLICRIFSFRVGRLAGIRLAFTTRLLADPFRIESITCSRSFAPTLAPRCNNRIVRAALSHTGRPSLYKTQPKIGRNEACPGNSGRKFKQFCLQNKPNRSDVSIPIIVLSIYRFCNNTPDAWAGRTPILFAPAILSVHSQDAGIKKYGLHELRTPRRGNTFVRLSGKICGRVGFLQSAAQDKFPCFGWTILTNDLILLIPFTLVLLNAKLNANATI